MRAIVFIVGYGLYLYLLINMIIDIESFWDFLWFIFIGTGLLALFQALIGFIIMMFDE